LSVTATIGAHHITSTAAAPLAGLAGRLTDRARPMVPRNVFPPMVF